MSSSDTPSRNQRPPKSLLTRLLQTVVLVSLVITGGVTIGRFLGLLESLEIAAYDGFIRLKPAEPLDDRLLVVGINENDIQRREEYPIEEGTVVQLIQALERYNPRAIALDFPLDFPQGTPAERAALTRLLAESDRIVSACLMSNEQSPGVAPAPGISEDLVGFADFPVDKDGVTRRSLLVSLPTAVAPDTVVRPHLCNQPDPNYELFSLSLVLADIYLADEEIFAEQTEALELQWDNTVVSGLSGRSGGYTGLEAVDYQVMLNYRAPQDAVRQVTLTEVLDNRVEPDWIRDRLILVGYTSPAVKDILTTPYPETTAGTRGMYGVVVHAQATSQLISAVLDGRPLIHSWPEVVEIGLIAGWGLVAGLFAFYGRRPLIFLVGSIGLTLLLWGLAYLLFIQGLWLPVVPMTIAGVLTAVAVGVVQQAKHSVYAQAIFEQIQAELAGQAPEPHRSKRDRLDDLVRRAQAIRQKRAFGDVLSRGDMEQTVDPLQMRFDSPEVQTFYEQIKSQLQGKFEQEKATLEAKTRRKGVSSQSAKLQTLLKKSQHARDAQSASLSSSPGTSND